MAFIGTDYIVIDVLKQLSKIILSKQGTYRRIFKKNYRIKAWVQFYCDKHG